MLAYLAPQHLPGGIDLILSLLQPFQGAAALFVVFRAQTLRERIMGCAAFNCSLLLTFFLLDLFHFVIFLFLFVVIFFFFLFSIAPSAFIHVLKTEIIGLFFANVVLSVLLFARAVPETSIVYEHGVALSGLITSYRMFPILGHFLRKSRSS